MDFLPGFGVMFVILPIVLLGVIGLLVLGVVARSAPDPKGRRPLAIFLTATMAVSLGMTLGGVLRLGHVVIREVTVDEASAIPGYAPFDEWQPVGPIGAPEPASFEPGLSEEEAVSGHYPPGPSRQELSTFYAPQDRTAADALEAIMVAIVGAVVYVLARRRLEDLVRREAGDA